MRALLILAAAAMPASAAVTAESAWTGAAAPFEALAASPGAPAAEPVDAGAVLASAADGKTASLAAAAPTAARGPEVPAPQTAAGADAKRSGIVAGIQNGGEQGALGGFYAVISPAASLLSEAFGRDMSRHYDGERSDNGGSGAYWAAGIALGVVLYIPALVAGGLGALGGAAAGAVSETVRPGSTSDWDVEKTMFGRGPG